VRRFSLRTAALALIFFSFFGAAFCEPECTPRNYHTQALVGRAIDGDTLILRDGRRLRLIGIDAPEIGYDGAHSQPFSRAAQEALQSALGGAIIGVHYDQRAQDRYGRGLAHIFSAPVGNVQAWLLRHGLALRLTLPPNLGFLSCYRRAESEARLARRGIWALPDYQPLQADAMDRNISGFKLIWGRISSWRNTRYGAYIDLGPHLTLKIARSDLVHFRAEDMPKWVGHQALARGRVRRIRAQYQIRIHHPIDLAIQGL